MQKKSNETQRTQSDETEIKQVVDNLFNQELSYAKEKEGKHSRKSSNDEQQETKIKLGCHKSPNNPKSDMFQMNTRRLNSKQPLQTLVDEQS